VARSTMSPLAALARGLLAGAAGTAAMDLYWYGWYRTGGGKSSLPAWEFACGLTSWDQVAAPGQVGKRLYEGVFQRPLSAAWAPLTTNVMHWGYGLSWGALYGLVAASIGPPRLRSGVVFGAGVWKSDYVILPLAGLYKPIWKYNVGTLAKDLGAHVIYGIGTAVAFGALSHNRGRR
jgi:hypothetical protein